MTQTKNVEKKAPVPLKLWHMAVMAVWLDNNQICCEQQQILIKLKVLKSNMNSCWTFSVLRYVLVRLLEVKQRHE